MSGIQLTQEQRDAVDKILGGKASAVSGPAGSGKTLVAMEIARRLDAQTALPLDTREPAPVYFVTYTNALKTFAETQLEGTNVQVRTVHAYLNEFVKKQGPPEFQFNSAYSRIQENGELKRIDLSRLTLLTDYVEQNGKALGLTGCLADPAFLDKEIGWMLGRGIDDRTVYHQDARKGRKTRLSDAQKDKVFDAMEAYLEKIHRIPRESRDTEAGPERGFIDFDEIGTCVLDLCEHGPTTPLASALIIDEVQDLPITWTDALKKTVRGPIVYAGDNTQSIYARGFTWRDIIGEGHRPLHLGTDFRNTDQIYRAAYSLMPFERNPESETTPHAQKRPQGKKPALILCRSERDQLERILMLLSDLIAAKAASIAVAFPRRHTPQFAFMSNLFRDNAKVTVTTLHSLKGLESDQVVLADLDEASLDFNSAYAQEDTNRHLLYVGMTRARRSLTMLSATDTPSWMLTELDMQLVDLEVENQEAVEYLRNAMHKRSDQLRAAYQAAVRNKSANEEQPEPGTSPSTPPSAATGEPRAASQSGEPVAPNQTDKTAHLEQQVDALRRERDKARDDRDRALETTKRANQTTEAALRQRWKAERDLRATRKLLEISNARVDSLEKRLSAARRHSQKTSALNTPRT